MHRGPGCWHPGHHKKNTLSQIVNRGQTAQYTGRTQTHESTDTRIHKHINIQANKHKNVQTHEHTKNKLYNTNTLNLHEHTDTQTIYEHTNTQTFKQTNIQANEHTIV